MSTHAYAPSGRGTIYHLLYRVFNAPAEGVPLWNFVTAVGLKKRERCPYQNVKMSVGLDTVSALDRQTELVKKKQYRALHALHADAR